jgi:hypothetical protein
MDEYLNKINTLQRNQGWNNETLRQLELQFICDNGLTGLFYEYIQRIAEQENVIDDF